GSGPNSWRRTYIVPDVRIDAANKKPRSEEVLEEERYFFDLPQTRSRFYERPEYEPKINYLGRVWTPPPEVPYEFPTPRGPYKEFHEIDDKEFKWVGELNDPEFKIERKLYIPEGALGAHVTPGHGGGGGGLMSPLQIS